MTHVAQDAPPVAASRLCNRRALVTVPVVKSTCKPGGSSGSRGRADTVSPTLAACSQSKSPGGRGSALQPKTFTQPALDFLAA